MSQCLAAAVVVVQLSCVRSLGYLKYAVSFRLRVSTCSALAARHSVGTQNKWRCLKICARVERRGFDKESIRERTSTKKLGIS